MVHSVLISRINDLRKKEERIPKKKKEERKRNIWKKNQIFWCYRDYIHQHVFLFYRDISSNSLGGNIPASIGKLYNLKNLYVDFFSAMVVLSLHPFFSNFYFLNVYLIFSSCWILCSNVSTNFLVGPIPSDGVLAHFTGSS